MRYKIEGKLHLWGWLDMKEDIKANIVDSKTTGNYIHWIEFETNMDKSQVEMIVNEYGLRIYNDSTVSRVNK